MPDPIPSPESVRLREDADRKANWKRWGPYLSERQWGTVREDYSVSGDCWNYFPHDHARSRAYRWGEDGLLGFTDRECRMCFALGLWNGKDPILKERLFGLVNSEGNHGEDVKECYYYLESTPTHSWCRGLYKYPQATFPYEELIERNKRAREQPEFELIDTGVFENDKYFDVQADYAKAGPNDLCIRITVHNRSAEPATLDLLPQLWFKNSWSWGCLSEGCELKPMLRQIQPGVVEATHASLGRFLFHAHRTDGVEPVLLFTDNETNQPRLAGAEARPGRYYKDAFHEFIIHNRVDAVNPKRLGTKVAAHYHLKLRGHGMAIVELRLHSESEKPAEVFGKSFDDTLHERRHEAAQYMHEIVGKHPHAMQEVAQQAFSGLLWSKQHYHYVVREWLAGDPDQPPPPPERDPVARNRDWKWHLFNRDVISMPDKWEYPWYAAWDLAFHMIPMARIDPNFAKEQLLLLREWYMHPNGQLPAYEFNFSDVNPPVHAWACWRVYKMTGEKGHRDRDFLARAFQKLMLNFTWWVNRKDERGKNLFGGGFLGLDNIGLFDRSQPLPTGGRLEQADGTAWMAFFCGTMLSIAIELAAEDPVYEDVASKFFEHFIAIVDAMHRLGGTGLWDDDDGFYYDQIFLHGTARKLKVRSMVGIIPLFAAEVLDAEVIGKLKGFQKRMDWFIKFRPDLRKYINFMSEADRGHKCLLAIPSKERLLRVLKYVFDESEFLSPYGVRSLSRQYAEHPYSFSEDGRSWSIRYEPGDSESGLFGGNSNWRGPVWFPVNYLLIEAIERYHFFYGNSLKIECPTGSGNLKTLKQAADEIRWRLISLFVQGKDGHRPCHGGDSRYAKDPHWRDLILFHEFFHGDSGRGLGASHQTGWTALVAEMIR